MSILGKLMLTVLAVAVAVAVPLLTTSAFAFIFQACVPSPVNPADILSGQVACENDALLSNQSFIHGVFIPAPGLFSCPDGERPWVCEGVPPE